jgi:hypothetical protein
LEALRGDCLSHDCISRVSCSFGSAAVCDNGPHWTRTPNNLQHHVHRNTLTPGKMMMILMMIGVDAGWRWQWAAWRQKVQRIPGGGVMGRSLNPSPAQDWFCVFYKIGQGAPGTPHKGGPARLARAPPRLIFLIFHEYGHLVSCPLCEPARQCR